MPQFSSSKKSLNATGPRAKHERKYDHLDFRPHPGATVYGGVHVKTTKTNRIVVGIPSYRRPGQSLPASGEVSIFSVDRDGVLYNKEIVITGELGNNIEDAGLVIDTYSDGDNFTIAATYEDANDNLGRIWVGYYTVSGETNTLVRSFTITNPDTSGTSGIFSSSDNFARSGIALIDHEHLVVGVTNYDVDYSSTGFQGRSYVYRKNAVSQEWQVVRTLDAISTGQGGYGAIGSISGRMIGTDARFVIGNWTYNANDGGTTLDGEFLEYNVTSNNSTTLIRNIQSNGNYGRGVLVTDDYTIISAPRGEAANGDDGAIYVYDNDPWGLRFILHTPLIDFPFNGGNGGVSNFGADGRRIAVDNNILYVVSSNADSVGGTGQTLGAIAKYDLITGQFIDYYHVPQRFPYNSDIKHLSVYEGRAFIVGGQDYYQSLNDSLGLGIYVIDDLVKPSTFWDSFPSVKALEQVSKKGEFGANSQEIYLGNGTGLYSGQPYPFLIRNNAVGVSDMSYDLDLTNDYLTIEVITASQASTTGFRCVLYLEHATDPTKDISMHIQPATGYGFTPAGGCGFRPGGTENGTNWITISHTDNANKHWGITFQKQTNNNFLLFNNGATFYGSDSNVYIDNAQNYVKAYLFRDPNEPDSFLRGRVLQVKISQAAPYGTPTSSVGQGPNYTNPVTNEDRIQPGDGTVLYWEFPTTRY